MQISVAGAFCDIQDKRGSDLGRRTKKCVWINF